MFKKIFLIVLLVLTSSIPLSAKTSVPDPQLNLLGNPGFEGLEKVGDAVN